MIYNMHISKYEQGNLFNHDPDRDRVLLLHKKEIVRLHAKVKEEGYTFPVVMDYNGEFVYKYGISAFPSTFIIDKEGYIKYTSNAE